jgi:hypothetical protein
MIDFEYHFPIESHRTGGMGAASAGFSDSLLACLDVIMKALSVNKEDLGLDGEKDSRT